MVMISRWSVQFGEAGGIWQRPVSHVVPNPSSPIVTGFSGLPTPVQGYRPERKKFSSPVYTQPTDLIHIQSSPSIPFQLSGFFPVISL
ncbi:uncharacterized protein MELLADRAFT_93940 [Melampsora larici-populina 98AG31]|uniref:Uncharacterized protein n=1 Tax=Melampsora larici-populina (strain 98AG31 / pathotype 3-4-7) TaxID=747676 RepID=F4S5U5_MELLP|nr:uncharacterized protein MELLADRAFT_93940 [Melampsora larici-populina 98AG31]EGG00003.1 hypothetical protein MELLADRAFT_93940 [Melampsora larici-populina 98AG31]